MRGAGLLLVTLGIYRFWLATDVRRFLWSNTEIAGDGLEYIGTARELLLGFLIAIALLVPINVAFFVAAFSRGLLGQISGLIALVVLALLGQFAVYRARRYRLDPHGLSRLAFSPDRLGLALRRLRDLLVGHDRHHARARLSVGAGEP